MMYTQNKEPSEAVSEVEIIEILFDDRSLSRYSIFEIAVILDGL